MKERYADQQHVVLGAVKLVPSVILKTEEKTWKTDVIKFAEVHRDSLPCWALLDEELVQWRLKWVGHQNAGDPIPDDAQLTFTATSQATFGNIFVLIVLFKLCIFPVTPCTCERSVSTLRRVKTFLRTSTGESRLSSLCLLTTYREIKIDLEQVINTFAIY